MLYLTVNIYETIGIMKSRTPCKWKGCCPGSVISKLLMFVNQTVLTSPRPLPETDTSITLFGGNG